MEHKELFVCNCSSYEHQLIFSSCDDADYPEMFVSVHLAAGHTLRERIVAAVKYIFGHRSRYGDFDEVLLSPEDCRRLARILQDHAARH